MERIARLSGHLAPPSPPPPASLASTRTAAGILGRPLARLPPSSRDGLAEHQRGTFWFDVEAHGLTKPVFPALAESIGSVDCCVVGAGICGLKLARYLARCGLSVVVLEGATVGDNAASARNQGCLQHVVGDYVKAGADAKPLEELGKENRRLIAEQVSEYGIECDWLPTAENYAVCRDSPDAAEQLAGMRAEAAARQADGMSCRVLNEEEATELCAGGKENGLYIGGLQHYGDMAATFHSGKYLFGLARGVGATPGVSLFERSRVVEVTEEEVGGGKGVRLVTAAGHAVRAKHAILATNACVPQFAPWLADALRAELAVGVKVI
jgi:glycine/D-amino acid oxidase-like deaminating enzyme